MSLEQWTAVDRYFVSLFDMPDRALDLALEYSEQNGLMPANVAPNQGKLLHILALIQGARTILEIGTLGGYSTIWLARALPPDGRLITLEYDPKHAEVARTNITRAELADKVEVRLGKAIDSLPKLADEGFIFDLIFIDADKRGNPDYFQWSLKMSRPGTVIIVDNVVRDGAVIDATSTDPSVVGTRRLNELLAAEPRVTATAIQTVGSKGYDGFALIRVNSNG